MAVLALCLFLVWGLIAFGVRSLLQLSRTGDSGFRGFSGSTGSVEWWAGLLFVAALAAGAAAPALDLAGAVEPLPLLESDAVQIAGLLVAVVGVVLTFGAQVAMGDAWRVGVDRAERVELVTRGPFSIVRNPIFSAMLVTAVGLALMVPNVVAVMGLVVLIAALELQVRVVEEPHLLAAHGSTYRDYTARVGRFVPGAGRRVAPRSST